MAMRIAFPFIAFGMGHFPPRVVDFWYRRRCRIWKIQIHRRRSFRNRRFTGDIANSEWGIDDLPRPIWSWIQWGRDAMPKSKTSLHLDFRRSINHRRIFGYIGHIRKIPRSCNTDSPFPPLGDRDRLEHGVRFYRYRAYP